jgi:hypothetical protein
MEALPLLRVRSAAIEAGFAVAQVHAEEVAGVRAEVCPRAKTAAPRLPPARPPAAAATAAAKRRTASGPRPPASTPRRAWVRVAGPARRRASSSAHPPHARAESTATRGQRRWRQTKAVSQTAQGWRGWWSGRGRGEAYGSVTGAVRTGTTAGRFSRRFRAVHSAKPSHRTQ